MAKFIFKSSDGTGVDNVDVSGGGGPGYAFFTFTSTQIKAYDDATNYTLVGGYGFARDAQGEVTAGTITSMTVAIDGQKVGSFTGLSIALSSFVSTESNSGDYSEFDVFRKRPDQPDAIR